MLVSSSVVYTVFVVDCKGILMQCNKKSAVCLCRSYFILCAHRVEPIVLLADWSIAPDRPCWGQCEQVL